MKYKKAVHPIIWDLFDLHGMVFLQDFDPKFSPQYFVVLFSLKILSHVNRREPSE